MFEHKHKLRIYYADTDAIGIVYHANYLRFFESARTEYLRKCGISLPKLLDEHGVQFAVVKIDVRYLKSARLDDLLTVISKVSHIGQASVHYIQEIFRNNSTELLCTAQVKLAVIDKQMRPTAIPDVLKKGILHDH